ncbi:GNAT family N-acetyltransferase, partial [Citrobacter sp. TBCS-14]
VYPRQGVGTLLMDRIHEEARQRGMGELTSNVSKAAEAFFLRHGFHVVERGFPVCRGVTLQNALMRKYLAKQ